MAFQNSLNDISSTRMSLSNNIFTPIEFKPVYSTPQFSDVNLVVNTLKTMEERRYKAADSMAKVNESIAKIGDLVNEKESSWLEGIKNDVVGSLQQDISNDNYGEAIFKAIQLPTQLLSRADVRGRIQANHDYQAFVNRILNDKTIDDDQRQYLLEHNQYNYYDKYAGETDDEAKANRQKDTLDRLKGIVVDRGQIVGGTTWKPTIDAISDVDLYKIMSEARRNVAVKKGGSEATYFKDAAGNFTSDPSLAAPGSAAYYEKSGTYEKITSEDLNKAIEAAIAATPGAESSLRRQFDVATWKHKKALAESNGKPVIDKSTDSLGRPLDYEQYIKRITDNFVSSAIYYNSTSSIKPLTGFTTGASKTSSGSNGSDSYTNDAYTASGRGEQTENAGMTAAQLKAGAELITGYFNDIIGEYKLGSYISADGNLKPNINYDAVANDAIRAVQKSNMPALEKFNKVQEIRRAQRQRNDFNSSYKKVTESLSGEARQMIDFAAIIEGGGTDINISNNNLVQDYNGLVDNMFTGKDGKQGDYLAITFEQDDKLGAAKFKQRIDNLRGESHHFDNSGYVSVSNNTIWVPKSAMYDYPLLMKTLIEESGLQNFWDSDVNFDIVDSQGNRVLGTGTRSPVNVPNQNIFAGLWQNITSLVGMGDNLPFDTDTGQTEVARSMYALYHTYDHNKWYYEDEIANASTSNFYSQPIIYGSTDVGSLLLSKNPGKWSDKNAATKYYNDQTLALATNLPLSQYQIKAGIGDNYNVDINNTNDRSKFSSLIGMLSKINGAIEPTSYIRDGKSGTRFKVNLSIDDDSDVNKGIISLAKELKINGKPVYDNGAISFTLQADELIDSEVNDAIANDPVYQIDTQIQNMRRQGITDYELSNGQKYHINNDGSMSLVTPEGRIIPVDTRVAYNAKIQDENYQDFEDVAKNISYGSLSSQEQVTLFNRYAASIGQRYNITDLEEIATKFQELFKK